MEAMHPCLEERACNANPEIRKKKTSSTILSQIWSFNEVLTRMDSGQFGPWYPASGDKTHACRGF